MRSSLEQRPPIKLSVGFIVHKQTELDVNHKSALNSSKPEYNITFFGKVTKQTVPSDVLKFISKLESFVKGCINIDSLIEILELTVYFLDPQNVWKSLSSTLDVLLRAEHNLICIPHIPEELPMIKGLGVVTKTSRLRDRAVVITSAIAADRSCVIPSYPGSLVLAVGRENNEQRRNENMAYYRGSAMDFVCPEEEGESSAFYPAVYAAAYVTASLIKANYNLGNSGIHTPYRCVFDLAGVILETLGCNFAFVDKFHSPYINHQISKLWFER